MILVANHSKITCHSRIYDASVPSPFFNRRFLSLEVRDRVQNCNRRYQVLALHGMITKCLPAAKAVQTDLEENDPSSQPDGFSGNRIGTNCSNEIKINVEVSGARTRAIFDSVFSKMVADAQPIPGFRRVKGGKTPDVPQDVLLQILGPSRVYKQVIKKLINSAVAEYVEKEDLTVSNDLRVEQSFEDLEAKLEPGEEFSFDATIQLKEPN